MKILNYIMLGMLLVVSGLLVTFWGQSKVQAERIGTLETDLNTANESLLTIKSATEKSDRELLRLSTDLSKVTEKGSMVGERVSMLERTNDEIRDLLSAALPVSGCLLDDSCEAGAAATQRRPDDPVQ